MGGIVPWGNCTAAAPGCQLVSLPHPHHLSPPGSSGCLWPSVTDWILGKSLKERLGTGTAAQEVGKSPSLEVFQNHRDVALRDVVSGHGGGGMRLDLGTLEVFSNLNDSVILSCGHQSWLCW